LLGISTVSNMHAQHDPWIQKADMNIGRHSFAASVVDDKIYIN